MPRLNNARLADWVEKELNGYAGSDDLPPYRRVGPNRVIGDFSGFAGSGLRNVEIPAVLVEDDDRDACSTTGSPRESLTTRRFCGTPARARRSLCTGPAMR